MRLGGMFLQYIKKKKLFFMSAGQLHSTHQVRLAFFKELFMAELIKTKRKIQSIRYKLSPLAQLSGYKDGREQHLASIYCHSLPD